MSNYYDESKGWIIDGQSLEDYENANRPVTDEDLKELGIIEEPPVIEEKDEDGNILKKLDQFSDYDTRPTGAEYEKLSPIDTAIDVGKAVGTEALHFFQTKSMETQYIERTHLAENLKYMYRYGIGTLGLGKVGAALKGLQWTGKAGKATKTIGQFLNPDLITTNNKVVKALSSGLDNIGAAAVASYLYRRPEDMEGQMADIFGDIDNPIIKNLQSNPEDTEIEERLKGVVNDTIAGLVTAPILNSVLEPALKSLGKGVSKLFKKKEVTEQALNEIDVAATEIDNVLEGSNLINKVRDTILEAQKENIDDIERYILDSDWVNGKNKDNVLNIYETLVRGDEPIALSDGSFSIRVQTWRDASKVTPEELARQTNGDGVSLMNETVKDTWKERGWLSEGEDLVKVSNPKDNSKEVKVVVNTKASNRIVKQYSDKWEIDNSIKVEWVDGKINGADGNTLATKYHGKNKNKDILPNITIQINKNAENPYAVLRSELEHARDISKREVPNQSEKHFNRYNGINESEMSLGYVKKKADSRASSTKTTDNISKIEDRYDFEVKSSKDLESVSNPDYDNVIIIKNKSGEVLGNMRTSNIGNNLIYIDMMNNYQMESGVGRAMIAKLAKDNPDKKIAWIAVSEGSVKSYNKFVEEYPDLINRIEFENKVNTDEIIDSIENNSYNSQKGVNNAEGSNQGNIGRGSKTDTSRESSTSNSQIQADMEGKVPRTGDESSLYRGVSESVSTVNERGKNTVDINKPITERINNADGDLNQVDNILDETIAKDIELSGTTWQALAEDADTLYSKLKNICGDNLLAFKKAFANGDINLVNAMTRKVLAAERMVSNLAEQANTLIKQGKDVTDIVETIHYLSGYTSKIGSAYGRGLNEQKFSNKVRSFFSLTTLEKQGLDSLVDLLHTDLTSLNFTQSVKQLKEEMYTKIQDYFGGKLWESLIKDPAYGKAFDNYLTELIANKNITPEAIEKALKKLVTDTQKEELQKIIKHSTDAKSLMKAMRVKQDIASYYVTNLLSSPMTQFKNFISGVTNSIYFPFKKIVGGLIDNIYGQTTNKASFIESGENLIEEGIKTYQYMFSYHYVLKDAWKLAGKAIQNGEGTLVSLGNDSYENNALEAVFHFKPWDSTNPKDVFIYAFTFMSRLMGATDEFITQMNYRAITRAKAFMAAERGANALNLTGDKRAKYMQQVSDELFDKAFDVDGKALDTDAYAEARDIVLQTPLDGKYFDYKTGQKIQTKEQTVAMGVSQALQKAVADVPLLKLFFPFVRTGTNILQQNLEHNIFYGICSPSQRRLLMSNTKEGAIARSQIATGLMGFSLAYSYVMQGNITGSLPSDSQTRTALLKTGWRPYSIKIGNKWVSYQGYEPIQSILGFAADCFTITQAYDSSTDTSDNLANLAILGAKNFIFKASPSTGSYLAMLGSTFW